MKLIKTLEESVPLSKFMGFDFSHGFDLLQIF